jgi:rhamnosyltransferase
MLRASADTGDRYRGEVGLPPLSVIVRVRDEATALDRCLELVRAQQLPPGVQLELIVVDNASTDRSAEVARSHGARVVPISVTEFSFGRALNRGAAVAAGEILVALSAHAFPTSEGWLASIATAFAEPDVACACGERFRSDGTALQSPVLVDAASVTRWPQWGYSNAAGAFRADLWRERPFREDLPGCEDKEWGRHWALAARPTLLDPALVIDHDHTHDPVLDIYRRARREAAGYRAFLGDDAPGPGSVRELAHAWWTETGFHRSALRARLSHRRAAALLGAYVGRKSAVSPR